MSIAKAVLFMAAFAVAAAFNTTSFADEKFKVAITARGLYEPSVVELGVRNGHFKKEGL